MHRLAPTGTHDLRRSPAARGWLVAALATTAASGAGPFTVAVESGEPRAAPALAAAVHAAWQGIPLERWTAEAASLAGMPVIRDRRIDPEIEVEYEGRGEPLADVFAAVAAAAGGRVVVLDSTVRIMPAQAAGDAVAGEQARRAEIARLPAAGQRVVRRRESWQWPAAARPRDLVAAAAAGEGIAIDGLEMIPHDHLPAASLPPLELGERLDLVLAHYDLRVSWDRRAAAASRTTPSGGAAGNRVQGTIVPLAAAGGTIARGPSVAARGPGRREDGGAAGAMPPRSEPPGSEPRFTLRLEATLEQAVAALAGRFGLEPAIDREALATRGVLPGEIVRVDVRDAARDDLFDAIVAPLGLAWRIDGGRLVVEPADSAPAGEPSRPAPAGQ